MYLNNCHLIGALSGGVDCQSGMWRFGTDESPRWGTNCQKEPLRSMTAVVGHCSRGLSICTPTSPC